MSANHTGTSHSSTNGRNEDLAKVRFSSTARERNTNPREIERVSRACNKASLKSYTVISIRDNRRGSLLGNEKRNEKQEKSERAMGNNGHTVRGREGENGTDESASTCKSSR